MGVLGGSSLFAVLYASDIFWLDVVAHPMLVVYAGLFGSSFLGLPNR